MSLPHAIIQRIWAICGKESVLLEPDELLVYECDAYPLARALPRMVVFPTTTEQASRIVEVLHDHKVPWVPRGAGTSLAGGCLAPSDSVCIATTRMRKILDIDLANQCATVEAGVITQEITDAVLSDGYHYAPDPSSQTACTIGGNVANNAGGPHTLKYGVTAQHVLGLTAVLPHGEILKLGGKCQHHCGFDLAAAFVGSEGTLGLVTEVIVRLTRSPAAHRTVLAIYDAMDDAGDTVSHVIADGIVPAALEMMDRGILNIVEDAYGFGFPRDAAALLIIELDGIEAGLEQQLERVTAICNEHNVRKLKSASSPEERALLWKARKSAFGALGRAAPTCITQDGVVPRSKLPQILRYVREQAEKYDLKIASNFHAGDGNIHPNFLFDARDQRQLQRVVEVSHDILAECVRLGGSVTGEHGVGVEKIDALKLMYNDDDLRAQKMLKEVFDPAQLANPNKVFDPAPPRPARDPSPKKTEQRQARAFEAISSELADEFGDCLLPVSETQEFAVRDEKPQAVLQPKSEERLSEIARFCHDHNVQAVVVGGDNQQLEFRGARDDGPFVVVSMLELNQVIEYATADLTITVQGGMRLSELTRVAAEHGQFLPIDAPSGNGSTIGGLLAVNASGPRRYLHRTISDYVLGASMVLADGTRIKSGAKTVKSVAGYDLHGLFIGSRGALGVIAQVTLMLKSIPEEFRLAQIHAPNAAQAESIISRTIRGATRPCMIDLLNGAAAKSLAIQLEPGELLILVGFEGATPAVEWQLEQLVTQCGESLTMLDAEQSRRLHQGVVDWPARRGQFSFEAILTGRLCAEFVQFCTENGIAAVARAGSGVVHGSGEFEPSADLALKLRRLCGPDGGLTFTHLPPGSTVCRWGPGNPARRWMRAVKDKFDPRGVFPSPGFLSE